jgi:glycosyltransferase involved in cell wall biosynthesis
MTKVAILLSGLRFGGAERVSLNLAKAFKEKGYLVDILVLKKTGELIESAENDFNLINLECDKTFKLPIKLVRYILKESPKALISTFWKLSLISCLVRIFKPSMYLFCVEHTTPSKAIFIPTYLFFITSSLFYQLSSKVICVSTGVLNDVKKHSVCLKRKLSLIHNPVYPPKTISFSESKQKTKLLWCGRLDDPKNPELMINSIDLIDKNLGLSLTFIGDGPQMNSLKKLTKEKRLDDLIVFEGYLEDVYSKIGNYDILILTSDREGLPTVLIEALYSGLYVISTDCSLGVHDIIQDGVNGMIVPCGDKLLLKNAIIESIGKKCDGSFQSNTAKKFLPEFVIEEYISLMSS